MRSHDNHTRTPIEARRARRAGLMSAGLLTAALLAVAPAGSPAARGPHANARAARSFNLEENGSLHLTSKHGFTLNEQGTATGTVRGTIYVHLKIVSSRHVSAEVSIYPRNGSITGYGSAGYQRKSSFAVFSGTMSIARGTGSYSRARGSGLSFSGTIQRSNDAVTVHVSGRVSD
jgi:hypothetical protein